MQAVDTKLTRLIDRLGIAEESLSGEQKTQKGRARKAQRESQSGLSKRVGSLENQVEAIDSRVAALNQRVTKMSRRVNSAQSSGGQSAR